MLYSPSYNTLLTADRTCCDISLGVEWFSVPIIGMNLDSGFLWGGNTTDKPKSPEYKDKSEKSEVNLYPLRISINWNIVQIAIVLHISNLLWSCPDATSHPAPRNRSFPLWGRKDRTSDIKYNRDRNSITNFHVHDLYNYLLNMTKFKWASK